ncbi:MAG: hypothetical protein LBP89_00795, partial [Helicobacteraceae bacterium]|nr:hypothetical protein [Helicobacteraceae bacterium]
ALILAIGLNAGIYDENEKLYYYDAFFKAMRLSSTAPLIEAELQCKKSGGNFVFNPHDKHYNDRFDADIQRLKESGIS